MNVLIAGGYGFIGSFLSEKLYKEGHNVFVMDNLSSGMAKNVAFRHKFFQLNVESDECETVFRSQPFDAVIYAVTNSNNISSISKPVKDSLSSIVGLENILHLCGKYSVPKFIFLSSAAVYGKNANSPTNESSACNPITPYGYHKSIGEEFCTKWGKHYNFQTNIVRIPNVYGPRGQFSSERGVIANFIENIIDQRDLHIFGDGTQIRDFIYVEDVADAVYRMISSDIEGIYNISSQTSESINGLVEQLKELYPVTNTVYKNPRDGEVTESILDHKKFAKDLDWVPKYSLQEGIIKTYDWSYGQRSRKKKHSLNSLLECRRNLYQTYKFLVPFIENIFQFLIFAILDFVTFQSQTNIIDYKLVYVLMIGMFLGKTQAILACFLTIVLYIYENIAYGREFISLFMDNDTLSHIAMYLFFGLVLGYIIDKKNITVKTLKEEYIVLQNKYDFLDEIFKETRKIKEQLQNQIMFTEDSVGKIFDLTSRLDSLEPEEIFNGSISVVEQTMKSKSVSIYLVSKNVDFLRLVSKSNRDDIFIANSIRVNSHFSYYKVVQEGKMVFNSELNPDLPILMAPIIHNGQTIGIICLNEVIFENLTLYYQNLFEVVIRLISSSLSRAFQYVSASNPNRYVKGTNILNPEYLSKVLNSKRKAKEQLSIPYIILEIDQKDSLDAAKHVLRETDIIGRDEKGTLWIILSNTSEKEAYIVVQRLVSHGLTVKVATEEEIYV